MMTTHLRLVKRKYCAKWTGSGTTRKMLRTRAEDKVRLASRTQKHDDDAIRTLPRLPAWVRHDPPHTDRLDFAGALPSPPSIAHSGGLLASSNSPLEAAQVPWPGRRRTCLDAAQQGRTNATPRQSDAARFSSQIVHHRAQLLRLLDIPSPAATALARMILPFLKA